MSVLDEVEQKIQELRLRWINEPENRTEIEEEAKLYKCCKCQNNVYSLTAVVCEQHREKHVEIKVKKYRSVEEMQKKIQQMKSKLF